MSDKLNEAIKRAVQDKQQREQRNESVEAQALNLWRQSREDVKKGVERINQDRESRTLARGPLKFKQLDAEYRLSDSEFSVQSDILPGRRINVRNCGDYLSLEVVARDLVRMNTEEETIGEEEIHFKIDENSNVFLHTKDKRKLYDAEDVAVYLLEKFWT